MLDSNLVKNLGMKASAVIALVVGSVTSAVAAVPVIVGTTITAIQVDALAIIDLIWPAMLLIFGGLLLMKIAKRGMSKL